METPEDIDRAAIAQHARRRRLLRYVLSAGAPLVALGARFIWDLIFNGSGMPKRPPLRLPQLLRQKQ